MEKEQTSNIKRLVGHGAVNIAGRFINQALQLVFILMITRYMGVDKYGIFSIALSIYTLCILVAKLGIDSALLRFLGIYYTDYDNNRARISGTIAFSLIVSLVSGFLFFLATGILGKEYLARTIFSIPMLSSAIPLMTIGLPFALVVEVLAKSGIALGDILPQFFFRFISVPLLRIAGISIVLFTSMPRTVDAAIIVYSGAMIVSAVLLCLYFALVKRDISTVKAGKIEWKKFLGFAFPSFSLGLTMTLFNYSDLLMLGILNEPREVGLYNASKNFAFNLSIITSAVATVYSPMVSGFFEKGEHNSIRNLYRLIATFTYILNMPAFLLIITFPAIFLDLLGPGFSAGSATLTILAVCYFFNGSMMHSQHTVLMTGHAATSFYYYGIGLIINIAVNIVLIPVYGSAGAAAATFIAIIVLNTLFIRKARRLAGINPLPRHVLKFSALLIAMFAAFLLTRFLFAHFHIPVNLVLVIGLGIVAYLCLIPGSLMIDRSLKDGIKSIFPARSIKPL